jgi:HAD superfamily hydrolase (TIGR01549 family)
MNWAIIFDVDGVLLELTRPEEELFFDAFAPHMDASSLSRDWNSYRIRNDEDIVREIVARQGLPPAMGMHITRDYLQRLQVALAGELRSQPITGATRLLQVFAGRARLGIATANFRRAAELRLQQVQMWQPVSGLAFGAEGGGPKAAILARALAETGLPPQQIIFIGDNVNDVHAGLENKVHFIGFSTQPERLVQLKAAGAQHLCADHGATEKQVRQLLNAAI